MILQQVFEIKYIISRLRYPYHASNHWITVLDDLVLPGITKWLTNSLLYYKVQLSTYGKTEERKKKNKAYKKKIKLQKFINDH